MSTLRRSIGGVLVLGLFLVVPGAVAADGLADCDAALDAAETPRAATRCYYQAARKGADWDRTRDRLEVLQRDDRLRHWATLMLAHMASDQGEEVAEELYGQALEGFETAGDGLGQVYTHIGLATFVSYDGRAEQAFASLEAAQKVANGMDDPQVSATVTAQHARQLQRSGEPDRAIAMLEQIEPVVFPDGEYQLKLLTLYVLAQAHVETGRNEKGYEYDERIVELTLAEGDHLVASTMLANQAQLLLNDEHLRAREGHDEVVRLATMAVEEAKLGSNPFAEAGGEWMLGMALGADGTPHLERARDLYDELGYLMIYPEVLGHLALNHLESDPQRAFEYADKAIEYSQESGKFDVEIMVHYQHAWILWHSGDIERARAEYETVIEMVNSHQLRHWDDVSRARLRAFWTVPSYDLASRFLFGSGDGPPDREEIAGAFHIMENARSRASLESIAQARVELPEEAVPVRLAYHEAMDEVASIQRQLRWSDPDEEQRAELQQRLHGAEASLKLARLELAQVESQMAGVRSASPLTLDELQAALDADQAMLVLQLSYIEPSVGWRYPDERTQPWALVVTRESAEVVTLPDDGRVRPAVEQYRGLVNRRDGAEADAARVLVEDVLAPVLEVVPPEVRRLVVVPDEILHRVSFGALPAGPDGAPLADQYAVSTVPSASLWMVLQDVDADPGPSVLVFADPELGSDVIATVRGYDDETRGMAGWEEALGEELGRLPLAREEARVAVRSGSEDSLALIGEQAAERALKTADLTRHGVLHLAAHAIVDEDHPERSAVVLTPGAEDEDGLLQAREVAELELDGQVVVLSACSSATGAVLKGEGVLGLARAFFHGGARAVVATQWPLRDDDAAEFFERFYRRLARGESVAQAVATAQADMARKGVPSEAWAGVVVLGDGSVVPFPGGTRNRVAYTWWVLATALVLVAGGLVWRVRAAR